VQALHRVTDSTLRALGFVVRFFQGALDATLVGQAHPFVLAELRSEKSGEFIRKVSLPTSERFAEAADAQRVWRSQEAHP
jgi:hypothetical protein